ncbi:hypothetical protein [Bacillus songklensis]
MFYYALFSWKKKAPVKDGQIFTFHTKTSTVALHIMLIHALALESVGFHYFLHQWNEVLAWVLLALNVYTLFFFLGEIQAIRLCPIKLTNKTLTLQIGLAKSMVIPLDAIKTIKQYDGPEKLSKHKQKTIFDATVADFMKEKPMFEIVLNEPVEACYMYGIKKKTERILLNADNAEAFYHALSSKLKKKRLIINSPVSFFAFLTKRSR